MHCLFRLVAVVVMLVAFTEGTLVLIDVRHYSADRPSTTSAEGGLDTPRLTDRVMRFARDFSPAAMLFCFGAILYVLTRISWVQEQGKDID